jgi:serine/threonine protein kinase
MPTPKKIKIDPTSLDAHSESGRFLHGFLKECKNDPGKHVILKNTPQEYHGLEFELTHTLHRRDVDVGEGQTPRYFVVDNPEGESDYNARGNQALVGYYLGALHPILNGAFQFLPEANRVYKNLLCCLYSDEGIAYGEQALEREVACMQLGGRLAPKALFTLQSNAQRWGFYYSMRKARGCTLTEWLKNKEKNNNQDRLFKVSTALIQALYLQVTRHGIVHSDIKPDNIFIEEGPQGEISITIIDYGFALNNLEKPLQVQGTPEYLPPEYQLGKHQIHDLKFDVYSLGKILHELWEGQVGDIPDPVRKVLSAAIASNPDERSEIHQLYDGVLQIGMTESERLAYVLGFDLRLSLDESDLNQETFIRKTQEALEQLKDNPAIITAFVSGLGWDALVFSRPALTTKQALLEALSAILKKPSEAIESLNASVFQLENHLQWCQQNIQYFPHVKSYVAIEQSFEALKLKFEKRIARLQGMPLDLDEISIKTSRIIDQAVDLKDLHNLIHFQAHGQQGQDKAATDELKKRVEHIIDSNPSHFDEDEKEKIKPFLENPNRDFEYKRGRMVAFFAAGKYQRLYAELCMAEKRSPVHVFQPYFNLIASLERIKNADVNSEFLKAIAKALRDYLKSVGNDRNLNLLYRAASNDRLSDIKKIETLIQQSPNHEQFVAGLKLILSDMKTGFFGRSLMKRNLNAVIEQYEKRKQDMAKQLKRIDVTTLTNKDDLLLVGRFLKAHIKKNHVVVSGDVYRYAGHEFCFSNTLVYEGEKNNEVQPPRFRVTDTHEGEGELVFSNVCGHLELTHSGACFYSPAEKPAVIHHYGPDINLKPKEMTSRFATTFQNLDLLYQQKQTHKVETQPEVYATIRLVDNEAIHQGKKPKDRPACGFLVVQEGETLSHYLEANHHTLSPEQRIKLMYSLLAAYREQVRVKGAFLTYLDLHSIIIAVAPNGDYKLDLSGANTTQQSLVSPHNNPAFMLPADFESDGASAKADAWRLGRVVCEIFDADQTLKKEYKANWDRLLSPEVLDNKFEAVALARVTEKENSRGFFARAWHKFTAWFAPKKTNKDRILSVLTRDECAAIQVEVEREAVSEVVQGLNGQLLPFAQNLRLDALLDLLQGREIHDLKGANTQSPTALQPSDPAILLRFEELKGECTALVAQSALFTKNKNVALPPPPSLKDLMDFRQALEAFDGVPTKVTLDYHLKKFHLIRRQLFWNAQPFHVENITMGNDHAKLLLRYLKSQVERGVTSFEAGHVFFDEKGYAHRLTSGIDVRDKKNGTIHYDVLSPLTEADQNQHSPVYEVAYVLKPGVDSSLMCVKRFDEQQKSRRLVKYAFDPRLPHDKLIEDAAIEHKRMERQHHVFRAKNAKGRSINQLRQPGVSYGQAFRQTASLANEDPKKLKQFLAVVRAFHLQVEINNIPYTDVKPQNLILNALPNGEDVFAVIDFEPGRLNEDFGVMPEDVSDRAFLRTVDAVQQRQPFFGLGVLLAKLYGGPSLIESKLNTQEKLNQFLGAVQDSNQPIPEKVRPLILDLLNVNGKTQNLGGLLEQVYVLTGKNKDQWYAYRSGCELRRPFLPLTSKEDLLNRIGGSVNGLPPEGIREFIRGLGFAVLLKNVDQLQTREELIAKIESIFSYKDTMLDEWTKKKETLSDLVKAYRVDNTLLTEKQLSLVEFSVSEAEAKVARIKAHYEEQCDLDAIDGANTRLLGLSMREFDRLHRSSLQLAERLAPRVQAVLLKEAVNADPLKQACAEVLKQYATQKSTLSSRRRADIIRLKEMISGGQEGDALKQQITDYVKGTLAGGMFGKRSVFKGKLAASLLKITKARGVGRG